MGPEGGRIGVELLGSPHEEAVCPTHIVDTDVDMHLRFGAGQSNGSCRFGTAKLVVGPVEPTQGNH